VRISAARRPGRDQVRRLAAAGGVKAAPGARRTLLELTMPPLDGGSGRLSVERVGAGWRRVPSEIVTRKYLIDILFDSVGDAHLAIVSRRLCE
jgi:hypothetical protein